MKKNGFDKLTTKAILSMMVLAACSMAARAEYSFSTDVNGLIYKMTTLDSALGPRGVLSLAPGYVIPTESQLASVAGTETDPYGNSIIVTPDMNQQAKYDWLKSSDRNAVMGALSATNRRTFFKIGKSLLTASFVADANYVDFVGLDGDAEFGCDAAGISTFRQKAGDIHFKNIRFRHSKSAMTSHAFVLDLTGMSFDNGASLYEDCEFRNPNAMPWRSETMWGVTDINGIWRRVNADAAFARVTTNKNFYGDWEDVNAGDWSYIGDQNNYGQSATGIAEPKMRRCRGGNQSFSGCFAFATNFGPNTIVIDCDMGDNSGGMGVILDGLWVRNTGKKNCFGGTIYTTSSCYGKVYGHVEDCISTGGLSFGMGKSGCVQSGSMQNNRCGSSASYATGGIEEGVNRGKTTITDRSAYASMTTDICDVNANITLTCKKKGRDGNQYIFQYNNFTTAPNTGCLGNIITASAFYSAGTKTPAAYLRLNGVSTFRYSASHGFTNGHHLAICNMGDITLNGEFTVIDANVSCISYYQIGLPDIALYTGSSGTTRRFLTASQIITNLQADSRISALFTIALAAGSDGTGTVYIKLGQYNAVNGYTDSSFVSNIRNMPFSGGIDPPYFKNVVPAPIVVIADVNIYPFDNGATYIVNSASSVKVNLPQAGVCDWSYTIIDGNDTATGDPNVEPYAGDHIVLATGTTLAADQGYISDGDAFARIKLVHYAHEPNIVREDANVGVWTGE